MGSTDTYTYAPLPLSTDDEIRLLYLEPGTGDDPVRFRLVPVRLSQPPVYEAVSYCWGDPTDTVDALCDGKRLPIPRNLHAAFRRLRPRPRQEEGGGTAAAAGARVLWADAACINQDDVAEKNAQVQLMRAVYTRPTRVLIWLGEHDDGDTPPEMLRALPGCIRTALDLLPPEVFEQDEVHRESKKVFHDVLTFRAPWFDRRWVIQEVVLANDHVPRLAIWGDIEFAWEDLAKVAYRLAAYNLYLVLAGQSVTHTGSPYTRSFYMKGGRPGKVMTSLFQVYLIRHYRDRGGTLMDGILATTTFLCTDPRDCIYSLLSMPRTPTGPAPDYAATVEDIYLQFATMSLVRDGNFKVLSLAPHTFFQTGNKPLKRLDLPSWVPDLSCTGFVEPVVNYSVRPQVFSAGGDALDAMPTVTVSGNSRLLRLRGRLVDRVASLATPMLRIPFPSEAEVTTGFNSRCLKRLANWLEGCKRVAARGDDWATRASSDAGFRRAFAETIVCGMTGMRYPAPDDLLAATEVYCDHLPTLFDENYQASEGTTTILLRYGALMELALIGFAGARPFCRTEEGRFSLVRDEAREGDVFCVVLGAEVPFLLRPSPGKAGVYTLVGDSYLHGVMHGEALTDQRYETIDILIE
ncbi:hypothetical protein VTI28DRAFT_2280 [Corynascus sepedonium]